MGYVIVRRRGALSSGFDALLMVPYIVPGVVMGIAYAMLTGEMVSQAQARFPDLPASSISALAERGIVNGQFQHQNVPASPLGYSCIDGFDIPECHVAVERRSAGSVKRIELFSDGYFAAAPGFGVAAWEAAADDVERVDPLKLNDVLSVKGSFGTIRTDDRTYVGVRMAAD